MPLQRCLALAVLLTGCASFDGRGLVAGQSTADEVERLMGPAADKRAGPGGETWLYYPRQRIGTPAILVFRGLLVIFSFSIAVGLWGRIGFRPWVI